MVVAQGGDRRTLVYQNPTGSYSYLGVARASFPRTYLNTDTMPVCTGVVRNVVNDAQMATALTNAIANAALGLHDWIVVALGTYTGFYNPAVKQGDIAPGGNGVCVIISKAVYDSIDPMTGIATVLPAKRRVTAAEVTAVMPFFKNVSLANQEQWAFDGEHARLALHRDLLRRRCHGHRTRPPRPRRERRRLDPDGTDDVAAEHHLRPVRVRLQRDRQPEGGARAARPLARVPGLVLRRQDPPRWAGLQGRCTRTTAPARCASSTTARARRPRTSCRRAYSMPGCAPQDWEIRWNRFEKPLTWNHAPDVRGQGLVGQEPPRDEEAPVRTHRGQLLPSDVARGSGGRRAPAQVGELRRRPAERLHARHLVRWNLIEDAGFGINIAGVDNVEPAVAPKRVWSVGNLYKIGAQYFDASQNPFIGFGIFDTCGFIHDTFVPMGVVNVIGQPEGGHLNLSMLDCIFGHTTYGLKGSGHSEGLNTLTSQCPGFDVRKCVFVGRDGSLYPANNYFPADEAQVGFTNFAAGDYSLLGTSQVIVPVTPPVVPAVLDHLTLLVAPSGGTSGIPLATQPRVKAIDDSGLQYALTGTIAVSVLSGQASVTAGGSIAMTNGIGTDVGLTLTAPAPTTVVLRFTHAASGLFVDSAPISIGGSTLTITRPASDGVSGVALPTQPQIQYCDAAGAPVAQAGVIITASIIPSSNATLGAGATATTDATGLATFSGLTMSVLSERDVTVRYSAAGASPVDESVHLTVPAVNTSVAALVCTRPGKAGRSGEPLRIEPRYEWQDDSGHVVPSCTAAVHIAAVGNVSDFGTDTLAATAGVVDFAGSGFGVIGRGKVTIVATGTP
jgi:hypothetical protein